MNFIEIQKVDSIQNLKPFLFFLRWRWQYVHWRLAQSNKTATLLCQPSTRRQCHGTRPNAFNSIRVLLHDTVWFRFQPFHPIEQCRGNREREREKRTQWLWLAASTSMVHGHGHPCAKSTPTASSWPDTAAPRQGGRHSDSGDQQAHIFAIFLAAEHTASRSIPVQRFSSVTLRMCCVVWPCPSKWHPVPGNAAHVAAAAANLLRLLNRKQSG